MMSNPQLVYLEKLNHEFKYQRSDISNAIALLESRGIDTTEALTIVETLFRAAQKVKVDLDAIALTSFAMELVNEIDALRK